MKQELLLIGVGNPLRGDDGVAHELCQPLATDYPFDVLLVQQLQTELLDEFVGRKKIIIADASVQVQSPQMVRLEVQPGTVNSSVSHQLDAALIQQLFTTYYPQEQTKIYLLHVPAFAFNLGEGLSLQAIQHLPKALELIIQQWNELLSTTHR